MDPDYRPKGAPASVAFDRRPTERGRAAAFWPRALGVLGALIAASSAWGALSAQGVSALPLEPIPIEGFELANGLRVVVSEDHSAPVVAVNLWYRVGSAHEEPGRTGFAHLFEHLMFVETENVGPGEMDRLISRAGGTYNGTTNTDRTAYFEVLPSDQVELAFFLHRERMAHLVVSAGGFESQRSVVREEKAQRFDAQPYAGAQVTLDTLSSDYGPYRHPSIGSLEDLDAARVEDVRGFHERYYVPRNATLVVAGDVTLAQVTALAETYFGDIPGGVRSAQLPQPPAVPRTDGERRVEVTDPLARIPLLYVGYTIPGLASPDTPALTLLSSILADGESSRLHRRLVGRDRLAVAVAGAPNLRGGPGFLFFATVPAPGVDIEAVETAVLSEIADVASGMLTEQELEKARNRLLVERVRNRLSVEGKANAIQVQDFYFGDAARINRELAEIEAITLEDLRSAAERYLAPVNRIVVVARPVVAAGGGG